MQGDVVISVRGLVTRFGAQVIHDGLDLEVYRGEVLGIVGGSGTGKSVLLKAMIGLIEPADGVIEVFDHRIGDGPGDGRGDKWQRRMPMNDLPDALKANIEAVARTMSSDYLTYLQMLRRRLIELRAAAIDVIDRRDRISFAQVGPLVLTYLVEAGIPGVAVIIEDELRDGDRDAEVATVVIDGVYGIALGPGRIWVRGREHDDNWVDDLWQETEPFDVTPRASLPPM